MGFFDIIKKALQDSTKKEVRNVTQITVEEIGKGKNNSESFTFFALPKNVSELQALPEASLDSAFKTAALTLVALCRYRDSIDDAVAMLDFLKGPESVSPYEKSFYKDRLYEKEYIPFSYFNGALPSNNYTPSKPYTVEIFENPYSFDNENWATLWVKSGGADNMRSIKFRRKPSTGQWFLNDVQCLSQIREPASSDPWA